MCARPSKAFPQTLTDQPVWERAARNRTSARHAAYYNEVGTYRVYDKHAAWRHGWVYGRGLWYRNISHFSSAYSGNKVIIEFARIRQGAHFYIKRNRCRHIRRWRNPLWNRRDRERSASGMGPRTEKRPRGARRQQQPGVPVGRQELQPNYGGLIGHVWLHLPGKIYQPIPCTITSDTSSTYTDRTTPTSMPRAPRANSGPSM